MDKWHAGVQFTAELVHQLLSGVVLSEVLRGGHGQPYKEEASIFTLGPDRKSEQLVIPFWILPTDGKVFLY